jgi:hypothetical protein
MLAVVRLQADILDHPPSLISLTRLAAEHELILVYADEAPASLVHSLRLVLRRYRLVSLMVSASLLRHEIDLIRDVVANGEIPLLLAMRETVVTDFSRSLGAEVDFSLPARPMRLGAPVLPKGA